jgi:hypothetical protein
MLRPSLPRGSCTPAIPPVPAVRRTVTIRPTEASKAVVRYVRNTWIRDVAQTSQMRKYRSSAEDLRTGQIDPLLPFNIRMNS